ncbi:MAG: ADP-glyceromanno-heptose 6-epimerase [Flavobacteriales bacterium]|nr:ADP-glyceromanno-heptose 6-epimerase [Flavobacteriales bacterium]
MIVVTGAAGFVGSCLISKLNAEGFNALVLVDNFLDARKLPNYAGKNYLMTIDRENFADWLDEHNREVEFIFHIGARTDTTEFNVSIFDKLNLHYSMRLWEQCCNYGIPMVYASSAATYGDGSLGYSDNHQIVERLQPLNPYGASKNDFDKWVLVQEGQPYFWAGLKFFNVYGPNEYHKGRMASVIFHAFRQINSTGKMKLFQSHRSDYPDGGQMRDFVYVMDVVNVLYWLMRHRKNSGLYNLGSGKARTFLALANGVFNALQKPVDIEFIPTPEDIRDKYQYFTEADMSKLTSIGYDTPFTELEAGISDYVSKYLLSERYF